MFERRSSSFPTRTLSITLAAPAPAITAPAPKTPRNPAATAGMAEKPMTGRAPTTPNAPPMTAAPPASFHAPLYPRVSSPDFSYRLSKSRVSRINCDRSRDGATRAPVASISTTSFMSMRPPADSMTNRYSSQSAFRTHEPAALRTTTESIETRTRASCAVASAVTEGGGEGLLTRAEHPAASNRSGQRMTGFMGSPPSRQGENGERDRRSEKARGGAESGVAVRLFHVRLFAARL